MGAGAPKGWDMAQETTNDFLEIIDLYFGETDGTAFADAQEQWRRWSRFVDLLCAILLLQREAEPPAALDLIGCLPQHTELALSLEPHEENLFSGWERLREIFFLLRAKSLPESGNSAILPMSRFLSEGLLEPVEWMAFLMAFCVHRSRKYEQVFRLLQTQDTGMAVPTVGLVCDLCSLFLTKEENSYALLLNPDRFLHKRLLAGIQLPEGFSYLCEPLSLNRQAYFFALGEDTGLGRLSAFAEERHCKRESAYICCDRLLESLKEIYAGSRDLQEEGIVFLEGEDGSGRTFLMEQLAAAEGKDLLIASAEILFAGSGEQALEGLREILCRCFFRRELLYIRDFPTEEKERDAAFAILSFLRSEMPLFFIGGRQYREKAFPKKTRISMLTVPFPDMQAQKMFWELFAKELDIHFEEDVEIDHLVSKYSMTPGRIKGILRTARLHAQNDKGEMRIGRQELEQAIRGSSVKRFGEYATKLETAFTWEDLQLAKDSERELLLAMDRIRLKSVVAEEYGFGRKLPYGNGTSIVLYGPPGTGKTMTAQVLAKELGLDIYRIDLSQVESKYIGETEKSLGKIFEAAKYSNAILFFDEADSLFAKRTEVKDSNDRHANTETAYLLQKIEEYGGVSILATNVFSNFDEAFRRRMTFLIPLRWPDEHERLLLWQKIFPEETPLADDVRFGYYAKVGELTGSAIKAAAVSAAYRAARDHRPVSHQDILNAIGDEYKKSGRSLNGIEQEKKGV